MQQRIMVRVENAKKVVLLDDGSDKDKEVDPVKDNIPKKQCGQSICNVSFSNLDLGNLVNGWPDNPVELGPL